MCGIFFELGYSKECSVFKNNNIKNSLRNRGPDSVQCVDIKDKDASLLFLGSVLWMQGQEITSQPLENHIGVILFNGDLYNVSWDKKWSDTKYIQDQFNSVDQITKNDIDRHEIEIVKVIKTFRGPFSLLYYHKATSKIFFTKDRTGRNSLLFSKSNGSFIISSVLGRKYKCTEIPAANINVYDINSKTIRQYSWNHDEYKECHLDAWAEELEKTQRMADEEFVVDEDVLLNLDTKLSQEKKKRSLCLVDLCKNEGIHLFTKDENRKAQWVHGDVTHVFKVDIGEIIVATRLTPRSKFEDLINRIDNLASATKYKQKLLQGILDIPQIHANVSNLIQLLEKSVKLRLEAQPNRCKNCIFNSQSCNHCTVGILFSGGLDCTILAYIADKFISKNQPIDLMNVAFGKNGGNYEVPDRITGRMSFEELKKLCPDRKLNFKEVNVSITECCELQKSVIADLVHPRQTILDESLGTALWFASRGDLQDSSSCRVLLVGSGADELFGGYTRHRNAFKRYGWTGLHKELSLDWQRISFRNLARDNRVICDHGRQPRMPYLDEEFTDYVLKLEPWLRCFPSDNLGLGIGDKLSLRLVAYQYGLQNAAIFPKRALQFGSRIANKKEKGSDISKNFSELNLLS